MNTQPQSNSLSVDAMDEKFKAFIHEAKKELGVDCTKKMISMVSKIFRAIRRSFTFAEATEFLDRMPGLLQLIFINNWYLTEEQVEANHLDELVEYIYNEDRSSDNPVFHSEIQTLNAIILILQKLDKTIGILNFSGFKFSLVQEIRQVAFEHAA